MRFLPYLLFTLLFAACLRPAAPPPPPPPPPPQGTVLTVLLEIRPPSDSIYLFDVVRGPGRLRQDYPDTYPESLPEGHLLFTFRNADERILKQTSLPFPGPNAYEIPSEAGTLERVTLPEEARSMALRTQDLGGLKWLDISGTTNQGRTVKQRIDLREK